MDLIDLQTYSKHLPTDIKFSCVQGPRPGSSRGVALLPACLHEPWHWPGHRPSLIAVQVPFHSIELALNSFFSSWDSKMLGRQLPSLTWNSANQLTIAYSGDNVKLDEVIPVEIAEDGECYFFILKSPMDLNVL